MKKYKPKTEQQDVIRQLQALGVKVNSQQYRIISIECDESQIAQVEAISKIEFEEIE